MNTIEIILKMSKIISNNIKYLSIKSRSKNQQTCLLAKLCKKRPLCIMNARYLLLESHTQTNLLDINEYKLI